MRKNNTVFSFVYSPKRGQETVRAMKDRQDCLGTTLTDQVKGWRRWVGLLSFFREKKTWRVIEEASLTGASKREQSVDLWGSLVEVSCRPTSPPSPPPQCSRHCDQARPPNTSPQSQALGSRVPFLPSPRCPALTPPWYCESCIPAVLGDYTERWVVQLPFPPGSFFPGACSTQAKTSAGEVIHFQQTFVHFPKMATLFVPLTRFWLLELMP